MAGVAYRTSTDYRNSGAYRESTVTVSPSTIACAAAVPAVTVTAFATAAVAVIAATTTVPAPTVTGTGNVAPSVVATAATTPSATISGAANLAPSVIAGVGAMPSATISGTASVAASVIAGATTTPSATLTGTASIEPSTVVTTAATPSVTVQMDQSISVETIAGSSTVESLSLQNKYVPVYENTVPTLDVPKYPIISPARNLARFYTPTARGVNIFILNDGSVTTRQPADVSTVSRTIYGGHESPTDLTSSELSALATAGYSTEVVGSA